MKNLYKNLTPFLLLMVLLILSYTDGFSQKNIRLRITSIAANTTSGTDCDANCIGTSNNRIDWLFDIDDGATDVDEYCQSLSDDNNSNSIAPNFVPYERNIDYGCQWGGNVDFRVEGWDEDCSDICIGGGFANVVSDLICTVTVNASYPSDVNGTYGPFTATCNYNGNYNGNSNCAGTITVTYQWEVSGSYRSQTSFDYICGAINKDTLSSGGTLTHSNFSNNGATSEDICAANEPWTDPGDDESVWFKFTTGPNPGSNINVDVSAIGGSGSGGACLFGEIVAGWCKVYEGPSALAGCPFSYSINHFTQLTQVGSTGVDLSDIDIACPKPNQTYYVQVEMATPGLQVGGLATCDVGSFNLAITDNGKIAGPDRICDALDLGQAAYGGPLSNNTNVDLVINNQTNRCASVAGGEPYNMTGSLDRTVWYKFRTPASTTSNLPHTYQIIVSKQSGSNIDAFPVFSLYKDLSGTGTRTCESFANLLHIDSDNGFDVTNSDANLDNVCLDPNTWYYIQVDHTSAFADFVNFGIRIRKDAYKPGDNICEATDLGYITTNGLANGVTTGVNWSLASKFTGAPYFGLPHTNRCASAEPGEPQASPGGPNPNSGTHRLPSGINSLPVVVCRLIGFTGIRMIMHSAKRTGGLCVWGLVSIQK